MRGTGSRAHSRETWKYGPIRRRHGKRAIYSGASDVDFVPGKQDITFARDRWLFEYGLRHVDRIFAQNPTQQERATARDSQ